MTGRTLEEIEAAYDATPKAIRNAFAILNFRRLLEIARTQRDESAPIEAIVEIQRDRMIEVRKILEEVGCDCESGDPVKIGEHACLAGRIEAALEGIGTKK